MKDRLIYLLLALVTLMGLLLLAIGLAEPAANGGGVAHASLTGMQAGGDGAARMEIIGSYGFAFHLLLLALIAALCLLGISRPRRSPKFIGFLWLSLLFTWLIAWRMYSGHAQFLESGETGYFLGFPTATAWAVYGTWLGAIPLILLYSFGFHRFIFTPEDKAKYQQLLDNKKQKEA